MTGRLRYGAKVDANHGVPREFLRDRCGGFVAEQVGGSWTYTANYRGCRFLLLDLSKFGGALTDWLIQCLDNDRFFWLESKTPEAYRQKNHDMTAGELWLFGKVKNFRFVVTDEDMQGAMDELINE